MNEFIDFALASEVPRHSTCQVGFVNPRVLHRTCLRETVVPFTTAHEKTLLSTGGIGIDRAAEMKLGLVPPLVLLCSDLLLHSSPPLISALPFDPLASGAAPTGQVYASRRPSNVIFHPPTGSCVLRKSATDPLRLGPCNQSDDWNYTPQKFLVVKGTYFCLQAVDSGKPAKLGIVCSESDSSWDITSKSKAQISKELPDGTALCLDVDPENTLITNPCLCLSIGICDRESQWFEFTARNEVPVGQLSPLNTDQNSTSP
ncbi:uncharacterized protein LOC135631949 [Musa acuminata AAA Group]|uniref:uncharacterized protein LOC135631949 n=1 Tax=Musa acuminata AAA Group TaxID=214697 RepID=UPI0031D5D8C8